MLIFTDSTMNLNPYDHRYLAQNGVPNFHKLEAFFGIVGENGHFSNA